MTNEPPVRPRLVLLTTLLPDGAAGEARLREALAGGDVSSVLIDPAGRSETAFQDFAEAIVPIIQAAGAAALVADDTRCAGRVRADGLHLTGGSVEALRDAVARLVPKLIVGGAGFNTRHDALEAGETLPDYLMFGKFGADNDPSAHPRNLALAAWWSPIVEIPCICQGGADLAALPAVIATGADFVALSRAVFADGVEPGRAVEEANRMMDAALRSAAA